VPRDGGPADRQLLGELADRPVARAQQLDDRPAVRVPEGVEGVSGQGLFTGVRTFTLAPGCDGATRFTMREEYTGPLLPMIWRSIPDLGPSFRQFANGLKERAER
jgi:hypothetical protein